MLNTNKIIEGHTHIPKIHLICNQTVFQKGLTATISERMRWAIIELHAGKDSLSFCPGDLMILENDVDWFGDEMIKEILKEFEDLKILLLVGDSSCIRVDKILKMGVLGIADKSELFEDVLVRAVSELLDGKPFLSSSLLDRFAQQLRGEVTPVCRADEILTRRELQILELIGMGNINSEIASKLSLSESTVKNHISKIFKKLKVNNRVQAVSYLS